MKPSRRKKKKRRYDFLNKEWIIETEDTPDMDWGESEIEDHADCEFDIEEVD